MNDPLGLKRSVQARDRLALQAEQAGLALHGQLKPGLAGTDAARDASSRAAAADAAVREGALSLAALAENLRIYQAELHAQADELGASQARSEELLQRFTALFTHMPVAALRVGAHGEIVEYNARAGTLLGLDGRGAPVRFLHRLVDAAHYQSRVRPAFLEARATGASALDAVPMHRHSRGGDGGPTGAGPGFMAELHIAWLPGAQGQPAGPDTAAPDKDPAPYICAIVERTEQLRTLQALRDSSRALQDSAAFLAESARLARIGGWELTLQPRQWHLAPELQRLLELPAAATSTLAALQGCMTAADAQAFNQALAGAEDGHPFELELDVLTAGGRRMRMLAVGQPVFVDDGEATVQRVRGVLQDITGPVQARAQISDLTERLSVANAAGGVGVWDWDLGTDSVLLDVRMAQLLGLDGPGERPARQLRALLAATLPTEEAERLDAALQALQHGGGTLNTELQRLGPEDEPQRWLHISARLHQDATGQALRVVGAAWDSSAEHEAARLLAAKESAEAANRSKSAFLSRMSHELRTPLNAILGFAQLMRMEADAGDLVLKPHRVQLIETAARHLLDLVNEVLDVTRVESGQVEMKLVQLDLREVVRDSLPMVQGLADRSGVRIVDHSAGAAASPVQGDRLRVKEVLINLLSNAVKYNHHGGSVEIRLQPVLDEDAVDLVVADTGPGLDAQQLQGLFQPFNRLGAEARGVEGSGMGLFVSQRFVEMLGGQVLVQSTPGVGSRFTVRLKAAPV
jgi:signal transduction histidine kinase